MSKLPFWTALIIGAGAGISASVARALAAEGLQVGLAARDVSKLDALASETVAQRFQADAADPKSAAALFEAVDAELGRPRLLHARMAAHGFPKIAAERLSLGAKPTCHDRRWAVAAGECLWSPL